ncbi:MAG TPA: hypothetical protein VLH13_01070 [Methanomassiliicoccales archaeon]|nr:hypothetical protein [Methanomassiliicoccales archaeon]
MNVETIPKYRTAADLIKIREIGNTIMCEECGAEGYVNHHIRMFYVHGCPVQLCRECAKLRGLSL